MPRKNQIRMLLAAFFGLAVLTSGFWRYFSAEGGHAGLWFGVVMGGLALTGSWLFLQGRITLASTATWTSLAFVGGWFVYESFVKKGLADAETRQLLIIALTTIAIVTMIRTGRVEKKTPPPPDTGSGDEAV